MSPIRFLSTVSSLLLAACASMNDLSQVVSASPDGPPFTGPAPTLTTDRATYVAVGDSNRVTYRRWHFAVIATLTNRSDLTLYIGTCPRYGFGPYGAGSAYAASWACVGGLPGIAVAPHAVRVDTLQISGPNSWDGHTGVAFGVTSGTLALSYGLATCSDVEECHAGTLGATSAPFTVTATP